MKVLNRYIFRQIFSSVLVVLLLVLSLDFIGKIIDQLDSLRAGYTFTEMLIYISWSIPASVYEFMPYAVLVGCLIGLGALAGNSELVVARAAGVSILQIAWMALKSVLVFILLALLLGEYVVPYAEQTAQSRRALALGYSTEDQARRGVWHREADDFILFSVVQPDGTLFGITRYHFQDGKLVRASNTKKAVYQNGRWNESNVDVTYFTDSNELTTERIDEQVWNTELTPALLNIVSMEPGSLSISNLHNYSEYLADQNLHNGEYALAFWQKALQPLATISLMLIAISFVFGPLRQVSMGQKIFTGVAFGIGFQLVQSLLGPSSVVFGFSPLVAVLIPIALCYCVGFYLLKRAG
ncbi:LPS export ABC transporter permease LptG [Gilvimarinus xylanilyticus]|uniref:LPS export ABC transporter permease LptG n=1 Tax=Gilvimarinus xylanilyticus TaxID=2944139 RepID=A0A9X2HV36_9GAMM|nr:LPS export ABC transporter permease LptG [Gilvimarinus xylanilyticus]MCP8898750.1 LPS export ABC transporter permease LptG [Gilvimarinus xylanilyticus]